LVALLDTPLLMTPTDQEKAWQATIRLFQKPIDQIRSYGARASSETELARTGPWMEEGFLQLLHLLPEDRFGPVRNAYALTIFEACANVRRKSRKFPRLITVWMENAIRLAHSPQLRKQLEQSRKKMLGLLERAQQLKDIPLRVWLIIIASLILSYWLGRISH
jgi:hypothetical protein